MEAAILMCTVALLRLISLSSAGQPRYPGPTGCSWQKGRECEWTHFCFFRPQLWRCLARCAKWSPLTHLPAFSGSAGYWWKRWHTWHSWNQGKCVPAVIMMSNFNWRWKKQKNKNINLFFFCSHLCRVALVRPGCPVLLVLREQRWVIIRRGPACFVGELFDNATKKQKTKHTHANKPVNNHCHSDHVEGQSVLLLNSTKPEHRQGKPAWSGV